MNLSISYGLWAIMMHQCRFIDCNKSTSLVWNFDSEGGCAYVGAGSIWGAGSLWEISVPSAVQFFCEPETALINKLY